MNPYRFDENDADLNHLAELYPELSNNNNQYYDTEEFNDTVGVNGSVVNDLSTISPVES